MAEDWCLLDNQTVDVALGTRMPGEGSKSHIWCEVICYVVIFATFWLLVNSYWPGIIDHDGIEQYKTIIAGNWVDWAPPLMAWIWKCLGALNYGPAPMLLLQTALYFSGFVFLVFWSFRRGRSALAMGLMLASLFPLSLAFMGTVLKDSMVAASLVAAVGLTANNQFRPNLPCKFAAIGLVFFAAAFRFNAIFACLPLLIANFARGEEEETSLAKLCLLVTGSILLLAAVIPAVNLVLQPRKTGVELSLITFDLGGITKNSDENVFPRLPVKDPVTANRKCYTAKWWDPYARPIKPGCTIQFTDIRKSFENTGESPYKRWAVSIARHPAAYLKHRLAHFNMNSRFLVRGQIAMPVMIQSNPNPWHFQITQNGPLRVIQQAALLTSRTPLGWPICWMALAVSVLILSRDLPSRALTQPVALSALLYGSTYLVFSVASDLRYHEWTMIGAMISAIITIGDMRISGMPSIKRTTIAIFPFFAVTGIAILARVVLPETIF